jgi:DNA-directed RNA polymerase specialized sigma24 family protein
MTVEEPPDHLSRISTIWTTLKKAQGNDSAEKKTAQTEIIERYAGAVYRYLHKAVRDPTAADDVFQKFALLVLQGAFRHASQERGRFRDYLKTTVLRLVFDHYRCTRRDPLQAAAALDGVGEFAKPSRPADDFDEPFRESCREELLDRAWLALKEIEDHGGQPFYSVLNYRAKTVDAGSEEMAAELTRQLQPETPITAKGIRKTLQRAREKFAELLLAELSQMCGSSARSDLEQELIELDLLSYCRTALSKR